MTEFFDQGDKEREELKIQPQVRSLGCVRSRDTTPGSFTWLCTFT